MKLTIATEYIHSLTRFGSQLGLSRMEMLLKKLSNPHLKMKFIHIAGTNGKGTTANMCARILQEAGYVVGLYTSPFVLDFRERFQVNGKVISKISLARLIARVRRGIEELGEQGVQVTEFEAVTAVAFLYFLQEKCDIVCLEVGLGGRLDATNVIDTPEVAVITSISYDHVDILGDSIKKIAFEKAGIIKPRTTVVTYPLQNEQALQVISEQCDKKRSKLIVPDIANAKIVRNSDGTMQFDYGGERYATRLVGEHQVYNTIAAICVIEELNKKGFCVKPIDIHLGVYNTLIPARFEHVSRQHPTAYLDGAHNMEAIGAFANSMELMVSQKKIVIMGMMADKEYKEAVKQVASLCDVFIAVDIENPRAADKQVIEDEAKKYCKETYAFAKGSDAVKKAFELAQYDSLIFGCGSFYMMADIRKEMLRYYKSLTEPRDNDKNN